MLTVDFDRLGVGPGTTVIDVAVARAGTPSRRTGAVRT